MEPEPLYNVRKIYLILEINTDLRRKTDGLLRRFAHFYFQTKRKMKSSPAVSHFQNVTCEKRFLFIGKSKTVAAQRRETEQHLMTSSGAKGQSYILRA